MRKVYTCINCGGSHSFYGVEESQHKVAEYCPTCLYKSPDSAIENWANVSYISFDEDIKQSIDDGDFDNAFNGEISQQ